MSAAESFFAAKDKDLAAARSARYEQIRRSPRLTAVGKARAIAGFYLEIGAKVDDARYVSLQRLLLGSYYSDMSLIFYAHWALGAAERLDDAQDAAELLAIALMNDDPVPDTFLAVAILTRACNQGWHDVVDQYWNASPDREQEWIEILDLNSDSEVTNHHRVSVGQVAQ